MSLPFFRNPRLKRHLVGQACCYDSVRRGGVPLVALSLFCRSTFRFPWHLYSLSNNCVQRRCHATSGIPSATTTITAPQNGDGNMSRASTLQEGALPVASRPPTAPLVESTSSTSLGSPPSHPALQFEARIISSRDDAMKAIQEIRRSAEGSYVAVDVEAFVYVEPAPSSSASAPAPQPGQPTDAVTDPTAATTASPLHLGTVSLIQLCSPRIPTVFILDVLALGTDGIAEICGPLFMDNNIRKCLFDCRRDVEAFSMQFKLRPRNVIDLQLLCTAMGWKQRGSNRRSGLQYVLKHELGIDRSKVDDPVSHAMLFGKRAVWDVRPLSPAFVEYAADDVRHVVALMEKLATTQAKLLDGVERLTDVYVEHYSGGGSLGRPVAQELDPVANVVMPEWLERYFGPAGTCAYCHLTGHTEAECFKKKQGAKRCSYCGEVGHLATHCFRKHPQLLKCTSCGQLGHTANKCFTTAPCKLCGGPHPEGKCHQMNRVVVKAKGV